MLLTCASHFHMGARRSDRSWPEPDDSPVPLALAHANIESTIDLVALKGIQLDKLAVVDEAGNKHLLSCRHVGMLRAFSAYVTYRASGDHPIDDNWIGVTREDYGDFRIGPVYFSIWSGLGVTATGTFANPNTIAHSARDPLAEFKKGIKQDPSLFPTLRDEKQWDTWRCSTVALAHA